MSEQAPFRAGFVALLGLPNAGKSALLNAFLGRKLSIVSSKPQTTRHKIVGILNGEGHQVCFLDTPGWLEKAQDGLQRMLIRMTRSAARDDADAVVLVVDPGASEGLEVFRPLAAWDKPLLLAVNKIDSASPQSVQKALSVCAALKAAASFAVSALKGTGVPQLLEAVIALLPESPAYYPADRLSDRWERFFASEMIREAIFELYRAEIPHACAVEIEEFNEIPGRSDLIRALIYVEKQSQKGILLGAKGAALRRLSEESLLRIERFLGRKAELDLWVKVRPNWRKDVSSLKEFGYTV
ncbi:MAG: GTPase Era [Elusimicrobia bacterium]|nr:GTPase Era [Elusimicrobiota bacterium]